MKTPFDSINKTDNHEWTSSLTGAQETNYNDNGDIEKAAMTNVFTNIVLLDDGDDLRHQNKNSQQLVDHDYHNSTSRHSSYSNDNKPHDLETIKATEDDATHCDQQADPNEQHKKHASYPDDQVKNDGAPKIDDMDDTELKSYPQSMKKAKFEVRLEHSTAVDGPSAHFKANSWRKKCLQSIPATPMDASEKAGDDESEMVGAAKATLDTRSEAVDESRSPASKQPLMYAPIRMPWESSPRSEQPVLIDEPENPVQTGAPNVQSQAHVQQDDHARPGAYAMPPPGQGIGTSLPIPDSFDDSSVWSPVANENDRRQQDADVANGPGGIPQVEAHLVEEEGLQNDIEIVRAVPNKKWYQRPLVWGMFALGLCGLIGLVTGIVVGTKPSLSRIESTDEPSMSTQPSATNPSTEQPSSMKPKLSVNESQVIACNFIGYSEHLSECLQALSVSLPAFATDDATTIPTEVGVLTELTSLTISSADFYTEITFTGIIPSIIGRLTKLNHLSIQGQSFSKNTLPSSMMQLTLLTNLELTAIKLTGIIPSWIGGLTSLTSLSLGDNYFSGRIPSTIAELTRLRELNISRNALTGNLASVINGLVQLEALDISFNSLTGTIPSSIGNLIQLTYLHIHWNMLSGTIPSSIGDLIHLTTLDMHENSLTGRIFSSIGNLIQITSLDMKQNFLSGTIPSSFENLIHLAMLDMSFNSLTGTIPTSIGNLTKLEILDLSDNSGTFYPGGFNGTIPYSIGNLTQLTHLDMSFNSLTGTIPSSIGNLTKLEVLHLSDNSVTGFNAGGLSGTIPSSIGNLTELRYLRMFMNSLNGTIPSSIGNLIQLITLDMSSNSLIEIIPSSIGNLTSLVYLDLRDNQFTGTIPTSLDDINGPLDMYLSNNNFTGSFPQSICDSILNLSVFIDCGELKCSCCFNGSTSWAFSPSQC